MFVVSCKYLAAELSIIEKKKQEKKRVLGNLENFVASNPISGYRCASALAKLPP